MSPISIGQFSELQNIPLSLMEPVLHERDSTIKFFLNGSRGQKFSEYNVTRRHFYCTCTFITRFPQGNNSIYVDLMWRCPKTKTLILFWPCLQCIHTCTRRLSLFSVTYTCHSNKKLEILLLHSLLSVLLTLKNKVLHCSRTIWNIGTCTN